LLMALGLHKHLGVLAATDVYRYLAQVWKFCSILVYPQLL
jgi:hypothetical protein